MKILAQEFINGEIIHLVTPQGADISFNINKEQIKLDDGIVSDEDIVNGHLSTNLPAGILNLSPVEGSAEGRQQSMLSNAIRANY